MRIAVDGTAVGSARSGARTRLLGLLGAYGALPRRHQLLVFATGESDLFTPLQAAGLECVEVRKGASVQQRWFTGGRVWRRRCSTRAIDLLQAETLPPPRGIGRPVVLTLHDLRDLELPGRWPSPRHLYARHLLPRALRSVARVIAVSHHTRRQILNRLHCPPELVAVVQNAADPGVHRIDDGAVLERFRERHAISGRFILALGHLEPRKNLVPLLEAVMLLRREEGLEDVQLVLAGRDLVGVGRRLLRRARAQQAPPPILTGPLDDEERCCALSLASCLAVPSLVEGFGIVPLEAMVVGCPVVAADRGALKEVVGDAGLLVDGDQPVALARALTAVFRDRNCAARLTRRGVHRAARFTWKSAALRLREVHDAVEQRFPAGV